MRYRALRLAERILNDWRWHVVKARRRYRAETVCAVQQVHKIRRAYWNVWTERYTERLCLTQAADAHDLVSVRVGINALRDYVEAAARIRIAQAWQQQRALGIGLQGLRQYPAANCRRLHAKTRADTHFLRCALPPVFAAWASGTLRRRGLIATVVHAHMASVKRSSFRIWTLRCNIQHLVSCIHHHSARGELRGALRRLVDWSRHRRLAQTALITAVVRGYLRGGWICWLALNREVHLLPMLSSGVDSAVS